MRLPPLLQPPKSVNPTAPVIVFAGFGVLEAKLDFTPAAPPASRT
jgi:hypothetical protein